ncbi:MAG TPA: putative sulfate exporter family transporter [Falsiroseomonas sp.]|jgi:uncharacterized integral membrane protein (TIGR00698 family)|nr:putative sulfate exporter family transporter [Falsiroseomonas sp.]
MSLAAGISAGGRQAIGLAPVPFGELDGEAALVVGADPREVAAAIALTAVLGVVVVLALPALAPALGLSATQYGTLAGLTVYAVPQVLAATAPLGGPSMQAGTLVKLLRVLMLGPVVLALSLVLGRRASLADEGQKAPRWRLGRYVPWFVVAFLALATMRSLGLVPDWMLDPLRLTAGLLTALAMAALGLGVDIRAVVRTGARVALATTLSLMLLLSLSLGLIGLLGIP